MGTRGRLTKAQIGYSLPEDAPLYERLPIIYKNVSMMLFRYQTDLDAAAALVPAQCELADRPEVLVLFAEYPWSTLGPYNEVAQAVECTYKGNVMTYAVRLHVTTDSAMAAGREIAGFPKKMAQINFNKGDIYLSQIERPSGLLLGSANLKPITPVPGKIPMTIPFICLRLIPSPEDNAPPSLAQLVQTNWVLRSGEVWAGKGSFQFTGASDLDPYHKLPVRQVQERLLFLGDMEVSAPGRILEDF
jgi:acetoacetate decarboxylase